MRACRPDPTVASMFPTFMTPAHRTSPVAAPARRLTFSMLALALAAAAALLLSSGASSAMGQAPLAPGPADPQISNGTAQQELDAARQRWQVLHISDYHFTVERLCFCVPAFRGPATMVVRDDVPLAVPPAFEDVATVPRLHAIVQKAIDDRVARLNVAYDARGIPLSIAIDRSSTVADDEITYRISGFTVAPPRINRLRLVSYHRTGGFLGLDDRLSVARNGLAIRTGRDGVPQEFFLSAADLTELESVLEAADFPSLKDLYRPPFTISDGFTYTLTYRNKTVVALEGGVPTALQAPIAVLDRLLDGAPA
jgi:hypothetical protein